MCVMEMRASHRIGANVDMVHCDYALTCHLYLQKTISYIFVVIDDSI